MLKKSLEQRGKHELITIIQHLYEKLGEGESWTRYITALREQHRNLRALKEELARAGL